MGNPIFNCQGCDLSLYILPCQIITGDYFDIRHFKDCDPLIRTVLRNVACKHLLAHSIQENCEFLLGGFCVNIHGIGDITDIVLEHTHDLFGIYIHAECGGKFISVNADHILKIEATALILFTKRLAGENIHVLICQLILYDFGLRSRCNDMFRQCLRIANTRAKGGCGYTFLRADNTHDCEQFPLIHQFLHIVLIAGHILPDIVLCVIPVKG